MVKQLPQGGAVLGTPCLLAVQAIHVQIKEDCERAAQGDMGGNKHAKVTSAMEIPRRVLYAGWQAACTTAGHCSTVQ
jgi:hypothetical protein